MVSCELLRLTMLVTGSMLRHLPALAGYIGTWDLVLLLQRRSDSEVLDLVSRFLVPLLLLSGLLRAPATLLSSIFFGVLAVAALMLLSSAGLVLLVVMLLG